MSPADRLRALRDHPHRDEIAWALECAAMRAALRGACRWAETLVEISREIGKA